MEEVGWGRLCSSKVCRVGTIYQSEWLPHHTITELAGLLKHIEPHRTYRKHTTTELARCVGCFCTTSGWFKHIEPTRTTPSQRYVGCLCTSSGWFKHIEPPRTYTLLTITELARCVGYFCTRAGWFKHLAPLRTYTNHTITELARCTRTTPSQS